MIEVELRLAHAVDAQRARHRRGTTSHRGLCDGGDLLGGRARRLDGLFAHRQRVGGVGCVLARACDVDVHACAQVAALLLEDGEFGRDPVDVASVADDPDEGDVAVAMLGAGRDVEENGEDVGDSGAAGNAKDVGGLGEVAHGLFAVGPGEDDIESCVAHEAFMGVLGVGCAGESGCGEGGDFLGFAALGAEDVAVPLGVGAEDGETEGCKGVALPDGALGEHEVEVLADGPGVVWMVKVQTHHVAVDLVFEEGDVGGSGAETHVTGWEEVVVQQGSTSQTNGAVEEPDDEAWNEETLELLPVAIAGANIHDGEHVVQFSEGFVACHSNPPGRG